MKKRYLMLCSLLAASLMLLSGFTPSDNARKLKPVEEKQIERYTIRDIDFMRFSLGKRSRLWERIESGKLPIRYESLDVPWKPPVTLDLMESNSSDIVIGNFSEEMTTVVNSHDLQSVTSGATVSSFLVKQVFKGALKAGDTIPLGESFHIFTDDGKEILESISCYLPSKSGEDYLLFLELLPETNLYAPNTYDVISYNGDWRFARYPILTPEQKACGIENLQPYELSVGYVGPDYTRLYNDVAKKYGI